MVLRHILKMAQIGISSEVPPVHLYGRNYGFYAKLPTNLFTIRQNLNISIEIMVLRHIPKMAQIGISF